MGFDSINCSIYNILCYEKVNNIKIKYYIKEFNI